VRADRPRAQIASGSSMLHYVTGTPS
jgi:hypothetical protein